MKIAFNSNSLSAAGTEVALFDYAYFNQTLLNNESIIVTRKCSGLGGDDPEVIKKFQKHFKVIQIDDYSELENTLEREKVDVFYAMKSGEKNEVISKGRKTCIHAAFSVYEPHGNVYAYVSEWLAKNTAIPMSYIKPHLWVPYMINLPEEHDNLREKLNIPKDAIVIGRYGSYLSFDIPFVHQAIIDIVEKRKDIYFLFSWTKPFYNHTHIIYLDTIVDLNEKVKFINTCDVLLHARLRGETFGQTCGEFSIKNKPVMTFGLSPEKCHITILGSAGMCYYNPENLKDMINNFKPNSTKNWDKYSEKFNPITVMQKFKEVFL